MSGPELVDYKGQPVWEAHGGHTGEEEDGGQTGGFEGTERGTEPSLNVSAPLRLDQIPENQQITAGQWSPDQEVVLTACGGDVWTFGHVGDQQSSTLYRICRKCDHVTEVTRRSGGGGAEGSGSTSHVKYYINNKKRDVEQQGDSLETLLLNGHVPQILLQSLAELGQLLLGHHHFLTDQQQRLERKRSRGSPCFYFT